MFPVSERLQNLSESQTIKMASKSREMRNQGLDVINLSLGEPDFDTPEHIKEAAKKAIDEGYTKYTPVPGFLDLREAISHKFKRDNDLDYSPDQIVVSTGAKQSLANIMLSLLNKGDEVLIPAPFWVTYTEIVKLAEATPKMVFAAIENDFKITPEQLEANITDKTKLILFSSPCNPTGSLYSKEEFEALGKVIEKYPNLLVVADEIYEHINFTNDGHYSIGRIEAIKDRVITVNGVSKGFAMTGWRLGYIGAPLWVAKACTKMQGQVTSATCSITQRAVIAALGDNIEPTKAMCVSFKKRRDLVVKLFRAMDGVKVNEPEGAFYLFPDVSSFFGKSFNGEVIKDASDLSMYILKEGLVSTVTGVAFGAENCIRLSYATSEDKLKLAAERIAKCLKELV